MSASGEALEPLDVTEARVIARLHAEGVDGIAIAFLHAYANPAHEQQMASIVAEACPDLAVTASSEITREWREFERTSTAVLNVYAKPRMVAYLSVLERELGSRHYNG